MKQLLAKVDGRDTGDERVKILQAQFPEFEFEVNDAGDSRLELNLTGVRLGRDLDTVTLERMKRFAQGILLPKEGKKSPVGEPAKDSPVTQREAARAEKQTDDKPVDEE